MSFERSVNKGLIEKWMRKARMGMTELAVELGCAEYTVRLMLSHSPRCPGGVLQAHLARIMKVHRDEIFPIVENEIA